MIYKGYAEDSTGSALNGNYDIRLMVLDPKLEDRILWSRIFLDVKLTDGYYDINAAERGNEVRNLFIRGNDLILRTVILDFGYSIQQYMSRNFQKVSLDQNKIFAENYPVEDSTEHIPELPFLPLRLICPLENVPEGDNARIELKIINYDDDNAIIRIQFYKGNLDIKTSEFTLEAKKVRNEMFNDFNPKLVKMKGYVEILTKSGNFIVTGDCIVEKNDSLIKTQLNWRTIK